MQDFQSVCSSYILCTRIWPKNVYILTLDWGLMCELVHTCQMPLQHKFGSRRLLTRRDNAHVIYSEMF